MFCLAAEQVSAVVVEDADVVTEVGATEVDVFEVVAELDAELVAEVDAVEVELLAGLSSPQPVKISATMAIAKTVTRVTL